MRWFWVFSLVLVGCATRHPHFDIPERGADRLLRVEATGYCACETCCGWERSWLGLGPPVIAYGPHKGRPKTVGITAAGTTAQRGVIAADTRVLPFGTILWVPGYGWGRVEDRGGAIQGNKIDLFFPTHEEALQWGRRRVDAYVWTRR
jgi:3D (Asp-Asp-Asp) domain-containing protein